MKLLLKILLVPLLVAGVLSIYGATLPSQHRVASMARYDRSPAEVWALITDVANWPTWREDIVAVEQRREAGGRVLWLVSIADEDQPLPLEVMESTEPKRFTLRISPDAGLSFSGTWSFQLSEAHQGTALTIMEEGEVFNPFLRALGHLVFGHHDSIHRVLVAVGKHFGQEVEPKIIPQSVPN
ncbi:MAG: SRPBCC family protein [Planctomycetota bacterium]